MFDRNDHLFKAAEEARQQAVRLIPPAYDARPRLLGPEDRPALAMALLADAAGWAAADLAAGLDERLSQVLGVTGMAPVLAREAAGVLLVARMFRRLLE